MKPGMKHYIEKIAELSISGLKFLKFLTDIVNNKEQLSHQSQIMRSSAAVILMKYAFPKTNKL